MLAAFVVLSAVSAVLAPSPATAITASAAPANAETFTHERFSQAQRLGRLIIVETYADWCAPCQIQAPIIERLRKEQRYQDLVLLRVVEDTPRTVWKELNIAGYGQFIVFRGAREISRGSPLDEASMRALLAAE